jgi:hypothetical protein
MTSKSKKILVLILMIGVVVIGIHTIHTHQEFKKKISTQKSLNIAIMRWKAAYKALSPYNEEWKKTFQSISNVNDLLSLYKMLNIEPTGINTNPETLFVSSFQPVDSQGESIGLSKVCMENTGSPGFEVSGDSFSGIINGLSNLSSRKDVRMRSVKFVVSHEKPTAIIENFCILLRP